MAPKSGWVEAVGLPPPGGSTDVGQVGAPTPVAIKATPGATLVVSTSTTVAVQVTYENAGSGQLSARAWLFAGTWRLVVVAKVSGIVLSPPAVQFPAAPEVSVWIEETPPNAAC